MSKLLAGQVAIVTGAGRGIGRAIALNLADEGASVVVAARSKNEILDTEQRIRTNGGKCKSVIVNVADKDSVQRMVEFAVNQFGKVNILVNNAGIQGPIGPLVDNDSQLWEQTVRVNLFGTFNCCQAVLPIMIAQNQGKIINLSGGGATAPRPNFSAYAASKAAIVRLTENLAVELQDYNIQVNAIAPGAVNTKMLDEVLEAKDRAGEEAEQAAIRFDEGGTPPSLAADLTVYLSSSRSDDLTGKLIAAPHDDWQDWDESRIGRLMGQPWFTLRRLDPYTLKPLVDELRTS